MLPTKIAPEMGAPISDFQLKRSPRHRYHLRPLGDVAHQHCKAIWRIVVQILCGERERRQLRHRLAVVIVATVAITEIEVAEGRCVLLDARQLRHIRGCFLVAHIDAVPVLLFKNTVLV